RIVRAIFLNTVACNQMSSRHGPADETPSSVRARGIFRSGRSRRFSGSSRLASRPNQRRLARFPVSKLELTLRSTCLMVSAPTTTLTRLEGCEFREEWKGGSHDQAMD